MRILVLGANGLLGSNIYSELSKVHNVFGTYSSNPVEGLFSCNLNIETVAEICNENNIEVLINCIGLTNIETCELFPEAAWRINAQWVHQLGEFCNFNQIKLVQISTDHFYSEPFEIRDENCEMVPVNQYGFTKLAAENFCLDTAPDSLILRVNFIARNRFGLADKSLLTFFLKEMQNGNAVTGFSDVSFSPVSAKYIAESIDALLKLSAYGLFNIASHDSISKFDFANLLAKSLGIDSAVVKPGSMLNLDNLANRPSSLSLNASKLSSIIKLPSIEQAIVEALELSNDI